MYTRHGSSHLVVLNTRSLAFDNVEVAATSLFNIVAEPPDKVLILGASATEPLALMRVNVTSGDSEVVRQVREITIDRTYFSAAQPIESHYLDGLVGPYPERRDLYVERSPIHHIDQLACPMILLQGLDDPVVPPNQAQMMYDAVRARHLPAAYLTFPGEQHGFLKAENNKRALEAELYFYSRVFGFELADEVERVPIENLEVAGP